MTEADDALLAAAQAAALHAYAPYSRFRVGAAARTEAGTIHPGCNVENASYGLTMCAERSAIFGALPAGHRRIVALALVCVDAPESGPASLLMPCGACRQVMAEFGAPDMPIIIHRVGIRRLDDLLPEAFSLSAV